jgi:hypothetical protein
MAFGPITIYPEFYLRVSRQALDVLNGTMKAALLTNSYVPDLTNHKVWGDVSAAEVAGGGDYDQLLIAGKTIALDGALRTVYTHDNLNFGSDVTISAKYLVRYLDGTTKYLWAYTDMNVGGGNLVVSGAPLVINVPANGVCRVTPNA